MGTGGTGARGDRQIANPGKIETIRKVSTKRPAFPQEHETDARDVSFIGSFSFYIRVLCAHPRHLRMNLSPAAFWTDSR